jgi:hypothetical protein
MNELDIKSLPVPQLEAVYLQISIQNQLNNKMLDLVLTEILNRKQYEEQLKAKPEKLVLPKLRQVKPNEITGTFEPPKAEAV